MLIEPVTKLDPLPASPSRSARLAGALLLVMAASAMLGSFLLAPAVHARIAPILAALATSELVLAIWLVVKGLGADPDVHVEAGAGGAEALR